MRCEFFHPAVTAAIVSLMGLGLSSLHAQAPLPPAPLPQAARAPAPAAPAPAPAPAPADLGAPAAQPNALPGGDAGATLGLAPQLPQLAGEYAAANQRYLTALQQRERSITQWRLALDHARRTLESSPDYLQAALAVRTARDEYALARDDILFYVRTDPQYLAVQARADRIDAQLEARRLQPRVKPQELADLAYQKLGFDRDMALIEAQYLARNADLAKLRERWLAAAQQFQNAQSYVEERVGSDPAVAPARQALDAAADVVAQAAAQLAGTRAAYQEGAYQQDQFYGMSRYRSYYAYGSAYTFPFGNGSVSPFGSGFYPYARVGFARRY